MRMNFKSHTKETIKNALTNGASVFELNTSIEEHDDVLIGSRNGVEVDICEFLSSPGHTIIELPKNWSLRKVTINDPLT